MKNCNCPGPAVIPAEAGIQTDALSLDPGLRIAGVTWVVTKNYLSLCKPRISFLVAVTAALGYFLAHGVAGAALYWMVLGIALSSASCACLNQYMERNQDALMERTKSRSIPQGKISARRAFIFGLCLGIAGLTILGIKSNWIVWDLTAFTMAVYLGLYTPLKRVTPHVTWVGALAGATPPLIGWAAAQGQLSLEAWILFAIQFLWQIPHFLALFWIYRADYARAGFKVMPVVDPSGKITSAQIALHSFSVLPVVLLPAFCGMAGTGYEVGALCVGTAYMGMGLKASWSLEKVDTRRLFLASLLYLPLIFGMLWMGA